MVTRAQGIVRREIEDTLSFLKSRGVSEFVHFTSVDNLPGILQNGLLPRTELERREIAFQHNDSLRLDGKAHVNLSISNPNIKMFYRARKDHPNRVYAVVSINPAILYECCDAAGNRLFEFSSTNAASRKAERCGVEEIFGGGHAIPALSRIGRRTTRPSSSSRVT